MTRFALAFLLLGLSQPAFARDQYERGRTAIQSLAGCYIIDYSYTETEALKPGYVRDQRVYDVNKDKTIKEWITVEETGPKKLRVQHILFGTDLDGTLMGGSELKHQAEDWEFDAPFLYDFTSPSRWSVKDLRGTPGLWTRRITNLDDGLRYQCASTWSQDVAPAWTCNDNYAPIPGRETRDMGRKDYNTLLRGTRIVAYGQSWLERQENTKTIHDVATGARTPLARELGKNWYVRVADKECAAAKAWAAPRQAFWQLLRETWEEVFTGDREFVEKLPAGAPPRFAKMMEIEAKYEGATMSDPSVRAAAKKDILETIEAYRVR